MPAEYCRLLARDETPIVARESGDNYILVREKSCDYSFLNNQDPPITGGGRVLSKGGWPEWWENWEEPEPTEAPPKRSIAELIAEVAGELDIPRQQLPQPTPAPVIKFPQLRQPAKAPPEPPKPLVVWEQDVRVLARSSTAVQWDTIAQRLELSAEFDVKQNDELGNMANYLKREQDRNLAALLLLRLLD